MRYIFILILVFFLSGCAETGPVLEEEIKKLNSEITKQSEQIALSTDENNKLLMMIDEREREILDLHNEIELKNDEAELVRIHMRDSMLELTTKVTEHENQIATLKDTEFYDEYLRLRKNIMYYFDDQDILSLNKDKYVMADRFFINDLHLYMTQEEVKDMMGEEFHELISYEGLMQQFRVDWTYEDGTRLIFNPTHLIAIGTIDGSYNLDGFETFTVNAKELINEMDKHYLRASDDAYLSDLGTTHDFYFASDTNEVLFLLFDEEISDFSDIDETNALKRMSIIDYDYLFFN